MTNLTVLPDLDPREIRDLETQMSENLIDALKIQSIRIAQLLEKIDPRTCQSSHLVSMCSTMRLSEEWATWAIERPRS